MTKHMATMGWVTTQEVRDGVSCPKCGARVSVNCIDRKWLPSQGKKNHGERLLKFRKIRTARMIAKNGKIEESAASKGELQTNARSNG